MTKTLRLAAAAALLALAGGPVLSPAPAQATVYDPFDMEPGQVVERRFPAIPAVNAAGNGGSVTPFECRQLGTACDIHGLFAKTEALDPDDDYYITVILNWFQDPEINDLDLYVWDNTKQRKACATACATTDPGSTAEGDQPVGRGATFGKPERARMFRVRGPHTIVVNNSGGTNRAIDASKSGYTLTVKYEVIDTPSVFESLDPEPIAEEEIDEDEDFGFGDEGGGEEALEFPEGDQTFAEDLPELADDPTFAIGDIAHSPEFDSGFGDIGRPQVDLPEFNLERNIVESARITKPSGLSLALALGLVPVAFVLGAGGLLYKRRPAALSI